MRRCTINGWSMYLQGLMHQCHLTPVSFVKVKVGVSLIFEVWDFLTVISKLYKLIDGLGDRDEETEHKAMMKFSPA
jgi:hypothetical protein